MWGEAICTTKHNEPQILHQTASYLAVDVEFTFFYYHKQGSTTIAYIPDINVHQGLKCKRVVFTLAINIGFDRLMRIINQADNVYELLR
jgi:hypothetical protein